MANIKSAKKRVKTAATKTLMNSMQKNKLRTFVKKVELAIANNNKSEANSVFPKAMSVIAKTAKKGIIKKNTASRKISRLNAKIKALA